MPLLGTYSSASIRGWSYPYRSGKVSVLTEINLNNGRDVFWNGSMFCIVGAQNTCYTSTNGVDWTSRTITLPAQFSTANWNAVSWNGSYWLAAGQLIYSTGGAISAAAKSTDGISWNVYEINAGFALQNVVWGSYTNFNRWYATFNVGGVAGGGVVSSADGQNWNIDFSFTNSSFNAIAFGGTEVVAGGSGPTTGGSIRALDLSGAQGVSWRGIGSPPAAVTPQDIAYGNGQFVMVCPQGYIGRANSTNLGGFVFTQVGGSTLEWDTVVWTGSKFIVIGDDGVNSYYTETTNQDTVAWSNPVVLYPSNIFVIGEHGSATNGTIMVTVTPGRVFVISI